ncbi:MAG: Flagellar hook-length control protein FliK [Myxococcaceae bacterium]|nr:Flagellar hook-length control protein FliK [Myxococcaceae bacterium]
MRAIGPTWWTFLALAALACSSEKPTHDGGDGLDDGNPGQRGDAGRDARVGTAKDAAHGGSDATTHLGPDPLSGDIAPVSIDACQSGNAAGLSASDVAAFQQGGALGSARFTYPYDGTVFPRGIEGPTLAWDGVGSSDAVYLHISSTAFEYTGCLTPTGANELLVPQDVWDTAGAQTYGKADPYTVELTVRAGGSIVGPMVQKWTIAQATVKGSVYYNSYLSLGGGGGIGGTVYRIPPKGKAQAFLAMECNGCHSVSANGASITSQTLALGARAFDIASGTPASLPAPSSNAYAALYPDGSRYLVGSQIIDIGRVNIASPGTAANKALLYDTATGATLPVHGVPVDALMPSFSPSGKLLTFNDYAIGSAHGLAVMDYDTQSDTARNYRPLLQTQGSLRPGWPFALPDDQAVVYVQTESTDFSAYGAGVLIAQVTAAAAPYSELFIADVDSGETTILARAMGYDDATKASAQQTNLPFGAEEIRKSYFPTVSPVAAGGYFWIFFDSLRHYGNRGLSRQLWGTAVEISASGDYSVDRSAPAFYLPGQVFGTGNHRAFTALDACKEDGASCESGVDCCGGSCTIVAGPDGLGVGACGKVGACAKSDERCAADANCCVPKNGGQPNVCIAGYCAAILL